MVGLAVISRNRLTPLDPISNLSGKFDIVKRLGEGAHGTCYKAKVMDDILAAKYGTKEVTIKVSKSPEDHSRELALLKCIRGTSHIAKGNCANAVKLLDDGSFSVYNSNSLLPMDSYLILVLEFVPGETFADLIDAGL